MTVNTLPNDRQLMRAYAGTEAVKFTAVAPEYRWYGNLEVTKTRDLGTRPDYGGTRFANYTPVPGLVSVAGTYNQGLCFEDFGFLPRYGFATAPAGVTDGQATPGFAFDYAPPALAPDFETATVEYGFPGIPYTVSGLLWNNFTISGDNDDAENDWKWAAQVIARTKDEIVGLATTAATGGSTTTIVKTGAGWTVNIFAGAYTFLRSGPNRGSAVQIASNTADTLTLTTPLESAVASGNLFKIGGLFTPSIPDRTREAITMRGTKLYLASAAETLGAAETQVFGKFVSFNTTFDQGLYFKWFAENEDAPSKKTNTGTVVVTGQVRLEFDDPVEEEHWLNTAVRKIRIERTGAIINASPETRKRARIDVFAARWGTPTDSDRQDNKTKTFPFTGFVDVTEGVPLELSALLPSATLPGD